MKLFFAKYYFLSYSYWFFLNEKKIKIKFTVRFKNELNLFY